MLKLRILTISILLPLFIWLILFASNPVFLWTTAIVVSVAIIEWLRLLKPKNLINYIFLLSLFLLIIFLLVLNKQYWFDTFVVNKVIVVAGVFWVIAFLKMLLYSYDFTGLLRRVTARNDKDQLTTKSLSYFVEFLWLLYGSLCCLLAIIPSWLAINYMQIQDRYLLLFACLIIIVADVGAYVVGKFFGKHKLTNISPKKTWEGVVGGYICSIVVAVIYLMILNVNPHLYTVLGIILLTSVTFIFSVIGDLYESLWKRIGGVKDSGNILPGHGGVLDRIDSFCAGMPMFLLCVLLLDKYMV